MMQITIEVPEHIHLAIQQLKREHRFLGCTDDELVQQLLCSGMIADEQTGQIHPVFIDKVFSGTAAKEIG